MTNHLLPLFLLLAAPTGACTSPPADADLAIPVSATEAARLGTSIACAQATGTRIPTIHHLSLTSGSRNAAGGAGVINDAAWLPSAINQDFQIGVPVDAAAQIDSITLRAFNVTRPDLSLWRLDHILDQPTFLGFFSLASTSPTNEQTFVLTLPHMNNMSSETPGTDPSSYFIDILSGSGSEGYGALIVQTSTLQLSTPPGC